MNAQIGTIICWCNQSSTELGSLSSVSEVGIGLFLALAVVQVVGSGEIGKLRRKSQLLRELVSANRLDGQRSSVAALDASLLQLELRLEKLSGKLFATSLFAIVVCIVGLVLVSLFPNLKIDCHLLGGFMLFHLVLPLLLFGGASLVIKRRCIDVRTKYESVHAEVFDRLMAD